MKDTIRCSRTEYPNLAVHPSECVEYDRHQQQDLSALVGEWRSNGGDQVRMDFEDAMGASG
jgi:hypothetical protein